MFCLSRICEKNSFVEFINSLDNFRILMTSDENHQYRRGDTMKIKESMYEIKMKVWIN